MSSPKANPHLTRLERLAANIKVAEADMQDARGDVKRFVRLANDSAHKYVAAKKRCERLKAVEAKLSGVQP